MLHPHRLKYVSLMLLLACSLFGTPAQSADRHLLWKTYSDTATVYMLGSIHLAKPGLYPLPAKMEQAFDRSDVLVVEIDSGSMDESQAAKLFAEYGLYPEGDFLTQHISQRTQDKLAAMGVAPESVQKMRPWFLATWLQARKLGQLGYDESYGIDLHFLKKARQRNMPVMELESFRQQLDIFSRFDGKRGDDFLYLSLLEMEHTAELADRIVRAWSAGDAPALEKLLFGQYRDMPGYDYFHEILFSSRNKTMAGRIMNLLERTGVFFVVVGAGHLVGEGGIPALLESRGFPLQQM